MLFNNFINKVSKAKTVATYRALNRSIAVSNTAFKRLIARETGLKNKRISNRFKVRKANSKSLFAYVSFGTKIGIDLSEFKPKLKKIKKNKRTYQGVTVKIGSERINPENNAGNKGFLATVKSGKSLVLARKSSSRLPTESLKFNLYNSAKKHQGTLNKDLSKKFKEEFSKQIKFEVNK